MADIGKKTALKILSLYLLTNCVFLAFACYGWYLIEKKSILEFNAGILYQENHSLTASLYGGVQTRQKGFLELLDALSKELEIPFMIVDKNGQIFFNTLSFLKDSAQVEEILQTKELFSHYPLKSHHGKIVWIDDVMYFVTQRLKGGFWHSVREKFGDEIPKDDLFLVIATSGIQAEINALLRMIFGSFVIILSLMGVVAYFLVLLSLKPLGEKINSLNAFIKDSTHEINTPLSVILMSVERIKTESLPHEERRKISRIVLAAKTLKSIYQDLLFYAFKDVQEPPKESISMPELIRERVAYFEPFFKSKNIVLHFKEQEPCKNPLNANYSHIVRVVDNLLENALKYTKSGGYVEITLGADCLRIEDSGCGIAKEDLPFIFNKYFRANNQHGGFGIGLSIVKQICDFYQLKIHCESALGRGSIFTLNWA